MTRPYRFSKRAKATKSMWILPLLICCVNKPKHHQLQGVFTHLTLSKIISCHLMAALCHTKCFLCGGASDID